MALFATAAITVSAQPEVGNWSIIPRIGGNASNLTNNVKIANPDGETTIGSKYKGGLAIGADFEYMFINHLSASAGAYYATQGFAYPDDIFTGVGDYSLEGHDKRHNERQTDMHYINFPLMINCYIYKGLALRAGVQVGFLVGARERYSATYKDKDEHGHTIEDGVIKIERPVKGLFKTVDLSIPVGISYDFGHLLFDLRYNIGMTPVYKSVNLFDNRQMEISKTSTFVFTFGLRLNHEDSRKSKITYGEWI